MNLLPWFERWHAQIRAADTAESITQITLEEERGQINLLPIYIHRTRTLPQDEVTLRCFISVFPFVSPSLKPHVLQTNKPQSHKWHNNVGKAHTNQSLHALLLPLLGPH